MARGIDLDRLERFARTQSGLRGRSSITVSPRSARYRFASPAARPPLKSETGVSVAMLTICLASVLMTYRYALFCSQSRQLRPEECGDVRC
jgi:hypothetical protein